MKSRLLLIISLLMCFVGYTQEFSFDIVFEDTVGNKDTITLGYDPSATDSIDAVFGEVNIKDKPFDSILDIRVANKFFEITDNGHHSTDPTKYHSKKSINKFTSCSVPYTNNANTILIKAKHFPLTMRYNKEVFIDSCISHSLINPMNFEHWFDIGSYYSVGPPAMYITYLKDQNEILLDNFRYFSEIISHPPEFYIDNNQDTTYMLYFSFVSKYAMSLDVNEKDAQSPVIKLYPNPNNGYFSVIFNIENQVINNELTVYGINGKAVYKEILRSNDNPINLSHLPKGVYLVSVDVNSKKINKKIVIN